MQSRNIRLVLHSDDVGNGYVEQSGGDAVSYRLSVYQHDGILAIGAVMVCTREGVSQQHNYDPWDRKVLLIAIYNRCLPNH